jgi:hypothetical protein
MIKQSPEKSTTLFNDSSDRWYQNQMYLSTVPKEF